MATRVTGASVKTGTSVAFRAWMDYTVTSNATSYTVVVLGGMYINSGQSPSFTAAATLTSSYNGSKTGSASTKNQAGKYLQIVGSTTWTIPRGTTDRNVTISLKTKKSSDSDSHSSTASYTFTVKALDQYNIDVNFACDKPLVNFDAGELEGYENEDRTLFSRTFSLFYNSNATVTAKALTGSGIHVLESDLAYAEEEQDDGTQITFTIPTVTAAQTYNITFEIELTDAGIRIKQDGEWKVIVGIYKKINDTWTEIEKSEIDLSEIYKKEG